MIAADDFIRAADEQGFRLYAGVPCSCLKPFINYVIDSNRLRYIGAANEGDAVAVAAGASLGGLTGVAMFQNSGLGNAVNPLTSLTWPFRIPILIIPTLRGEPDGEADEPQHQLMGAITTHMLETMEIAWEYFPDDAGQIGPAIGRAVEHMRKTNLPYALVMRKDSVEPFDLKSATEIRTVQHSSSGAGDSTFSRREMLAVIQECCAPDDAIIATTGYTGRELFGLADKSNQLYMVGSMGCASSLGLGLSIAQPNRRIVVIDGDGAALMRLGALTTIGYERPANMLHILLDNNVHDSTGGQSTVSHSIDFCAIAGACGYPATAAVSTPDTLAGYLTSATEVLTFLHVRIRRGTSEPLPRPTLAPDQVADRFREFLGGS